MPAKMPPAAIVPRKNVQYSICASQVRHDHGIGLLLLTSLNACMQITSPFCRPAFRNPAANLLAAVTACRWDMHRYGFAASMYTYMTDQKMGKDLAELRGAYWLVHIVGRLIEHP